MFSFEITGFNELEQELNQAKKDMTNLTETEQISFDELFSTSFMKKHTSYSSLEEFFKSGGFNIESEEDFDAIPENKLNQHISSTTHFASWEDMLNEAVTQYVTLKLDF